MPWTGAVDVADMRAAMLKLESTSSAVDEESVIEAELARGCICQGLGLALFIAALSSKINAPVLGLAEGALLEGQHGRHILGQTDGMGLRRESRPERSVRPPRTGL